MAMLKIVFLSFYVMLYSSEGYKILVVYPMPAVSHKILGDGVIRPLLKSGHEVTYITPFEYKNPPPNLRQIDVSANSRLIPPEITINLHQILNGEMTSADRAVLINIMRSIAVETLENRNVQNLLKDPTEQFDVVIAEWMLVSLMSGLAAVFSCPLIWMSPVEVHSGILSLIDAAPNPAYTTDLLSIKIPPFTFIERVEELWRRITERLDDYAYFDDLEEYEYYRLIAPLILKRERLPFPYEDVRYNISLVLSISHVSNGLAISLPQNYKPLGGYYINEEMEPLPEELEIKLKSNKNGVIYFSMGTNLDSKDFPKSIRNTLLKLFGSLKQTVLWKFEEDIANLPDNVHIMKWAPQMSILSHPNCVLFITHGGLLSIIETIYTGVPIIGVPVYGDQFSNIKRAVAKGYALEVNLSHLLADDLKVAIRTIIHDSRYKKRVKELSFIYHDRIIKPADELVHWVQHVVRTRGAPHLRSVAVGVPLYQRLYLDLVALLAVIVVVIVALFKLLCAAVCTKKWFRMLCAAVCAKKKIYARKKYK